MHRTLLYTHLVLIMKNQATGALPRRPPEGSIHTRSRSRVAPSSIDPIAVLHGHNLHSVRKGILPETLRRRIDQDLSSAPDGRWTVDTPRMHMISLQLFCARCRVDFGPHTYTTLFPWNASIVPYRSPRLSTTIQCPPGC